MKVRNNITLTEINKRYYYDETSPTLLRHRSGKYKDQIAGSLHNTGYYRVKHNKIEIKVHRILYQIYHNIENLGEIKIDHIDNDRTNNKKENLRESNDSTNMWNRSIGRNSKTGIKGLHLKRRKDGTYYYYCRILKNYERHDKCFKYCEKGLNDAIKWLDDMRESLHGEFKNSG